MNLVSWVICAAMLWFLSPILIPFIILYGVVKVLNVFVVGKAIEEAHHDH